MMAHIPRLSGEEWQNWANKLLTYHYGPMEYQKVQDNDRGDAGIEGFTISDGHAYQAYGCEEPLSTGERYEKQRDKITRDIKKFIDNRSVLEKIFGTVKITRWALFVPYWDSKEIVVHASKKTNEVIEAKLPYVSDGFRVMVCHEEDFSIAKNMVVSASTNALKFSTDRATHEQISQWASSNDSLSATLDDKIRRLPTISSDQARHAFRDKVLKWHLEGQAILEALRKYPDVYEKVIEAKSHRENYLVLSAISGRTPQSILVSSIEEIKETIKQEVSELHSLSAESLAYEAVADWLLRCPLDFPEALPNGQQ